MKTSSAKSKGRALQNLVVKDLRKAYSLDEQVDSLYEGHIQAQLMGASGTDVRLSPTAMEIIPFDIECKNQEKWSVHSWWKQTTANTKDGRVPLLVMKRNRSEPLVLLSWKDFVRML